MRLNRKEFIRKGTALADAGVAGFGIDPLPGQSGIDPAAARSGVTWPVAEGPDTPKMCLGISPEATPKQMRRWKQIGIDHLQLIGKPIPWSHDFVDATMKRFSEHGLTVLNMMVYGFQNAVYGRPGRDEEIEKVQNSIRAAGKAGPPVVEYNFYVDRLKEGYYREEGRGGAGYTAFDYHPVKDLPPEPSIGVYSSEELWENLAYFLKAVVPVAENSGVRLALHPNDPPAPVSHGSDQIMTRFSDWKRLIEIVDSPSNGITYDCGVTREIGEDPVEVCRYFGSRDRINHMHFRNVLVKKPSEKYTEVFPDEGQVNMFEVMNELVRCGYNRGLCPEHPRELEYDRNHPEYKTPFYPGGGGVSSYTYNVGYTRAMLQAALTNCYGGPVQSPRET